MRHRCYFCNRSLKSTKDRWRHAATAGHQKRKAKWYERFFKRNPEVLQQVLAKSIALENPKPYEEM